MMQKNVIFILLKSVLFCVLIIMTARCNIKEHLELTLPINSTHLEQYYKKNENNLIYLNLSKKFKKQIKPFNQQEIKIPIKGYIFGSKYIDKNINYYELGQFSNKNNTYKLIAYNKTGEADTPLFNVQLNSYSQDGNLVDALLLSSSFSYEGMDCFSNFHIHPDYTISIDHYVTYLYEVDKDGISDIKNKNPTSHIYLKEKYQIKEGRFELIFHSEKTKQD